MRPALDTHKGKAARLLFLSFLLFSLSALPAFWWLALVCLIPFFKLLSAPSRPLQAFRAGYGFGLLVFGLVLLWVSNTHLLFYVAAVLIHALFLGLFGLSARRVLQKNYPSWLLALKLAALWIIIEYIRSRSAWLLPAGHLGYHLASSLPLLQLASLSGVFGLSFFAVLINGLLYAAVFAEPSPRGKMFSAGLAVIVLAAAFLWGASELRRPLPPETLTVAVIQPCLRGEEKWDMAFLGGTFEQHQRLTLQALSIWPRPGLVVWPETSIPAFLFHPERKDLLEKVQALCRDQKVPLLLGTQDLALDGRGKKAFNSAALFDTRGDLVGTYDKIHLVPLSERSPHPKLIPSLRRHGLMSIYSPGTPRAPWVLDDGTRLSAVICFETLFPALTRSFVKSGAQILANLTNDSPALKGMAFYYRVNADITRVRAVEVRRSLVRAANNGISLAVDPWGRVIAQKGLNEPGVMRAELPRMPAQTLYARWGDWLVLLALLIEGVAVHRCLRSTLVAQIRKRVARGELTL